MYPPLKSIRSRLNALRKPWVLWSLMPAGIIGAICLLPFLAMAMLIGSRLLMLVMGPVNIWNATRHAPVAADLAGYYGLSGNNLPSRALRSGIISERSGFRLNADHTFEANALPNFDSSGDQAECNYSGTGTWSLLENADVTLVLNLEVSVPPRTGELPSCAPAWLGLFELLGHSPPYRIWYNVGDPDEGMGLTYARQHP